MKPSDPRLWPYSEQQGTLPSVAPPSNNAVAIAGTNVAAGADGVSNGNAVSLVNPNDPFGRQSVLLLDTVVVELAASDNSGKLELLAITANIVPNAAAPATKRITTPQLILPGTLPFPFPANSNAAFDVFALPIRALGGWEFNTLGAGTTGYPLMYVNFTIRNTDAVNAHAWTATAFINYRIVSGLSGN